MNIENEYNPGIEFLSLRDELLQGKKYVFERPLLIITLTVALLHFLGEPYAPLIPVTAIGLLMFNLWFTVNRMKSIACISAYIQVELEEKLFKPWLGWETSLRLYRKWIKLEKENREEIIKQKIDKAVIQRARDRYSTDYYSLIYFMHLIIVIISALGSVFYLLRDIKNITFIYYVTYLITLILLILFCFIAFYWRPSAIRKIIEENRVIWMEAFAANDRPKYEVIN